MASFTGLYLKILAQHVELRRMESPIRTVLQDMDCAIAPVEIDRIYLAVHELCLHIIGGGIDRSACLTVVVEPQAHGCAVTVTAPQPTAAIFPGGNAFLVEDMAVESLPFWTVLQLMDEVTSDSQTGSDRWRMVKHMA